MKNRFRCLSHFIFSSLLLCGTSSWAALRCVNIFRLNSHTDISARAEQIVFSSQQMETVFSRIKAMTGASSNADALVQLKQKRSKDFLVLQKRIQLASDTIEILSSAEEYQKIDGRLKSLAYRDLTNSILSLTESHGWGSYLRPGDALYFSDDYKSSNIASVILGAKEKKQQWFIDIDTRMSISKYISTLVETSLNTEKALTHLDSGLVVLQMTYKKGLPAIEEIVRLSQKILSLLEAYDYSFIMKVNDLPINETIYIDHQLTHHIDRLTEFFKQATPQQRASLQTDDLIEKLREYQGQIDTEVSQYENKTQSMAEISRLWEKLTDKK